MKAILIELFGIESHTLFARVAALDCRVTRWFPDKTFLTAETDFSY
jgi:hypothetical protein